MATHNIKTIRRYSAHRNLNRGGTKYSVKKDDVVWQYAEVVELCDVVMKHPTKKQIEDVRTGNRKVVSWIRGNRVYCDQPVNIEGMSRLGCDPRVGKFTDLDTGVVVNTAARVVMCDTGVYYEKKR